MKLNEINQGIVGSKKRQRVGRGIGSGHGKTSGRGHKGQGALSGYTRNPIFESGGTPLVRRIPKRGFNNPFALDIAEVNIGDLEALFEAGEEVSIETLQGHGLLRGRFDLLKVLGDGELSKKLSVSAHRFSKSAREKIEKAGGTVTVVPGKIPVELKKYQKRLAEGKIKPKAGKKSGK